MRARHASRPSSCSWTLLSWRSRLPSSSAAPLPLRRPPRRSRRPRRRRRSHQRHRPSRPSASPWLRALRCPHRHRSLLRRRWSRNRQSQLPCPRRLSSPPPRSIRKSRSGQAMLPTRPGPPPRKPPGSMQRHRVPRCNQACRHANHRPGSPLPATGCLKATWSRKSACSFSSLASASC